MSIISLILLTGCQGTYSHAMPHPLLGQIIPLPGENRERAVDSEYLKEMPIRHTTMVIFWSPFCSACKTWLTQVDRLWRKVQNPPIDARGIVGHAESDDAMKIIQQYRIGFPQFLDRNGKWMMHLHLTTIPTIMLLDHYGRLQYVSSPEATLDKIEREFWQLYESDLGSNTVRLRWNTRQ